MPNSAPSASLLWAPQTARVAHPKSGGLLAVLFLVVVVPALGAVGRQAPATDLAPVPHPPLDSMEDGVRAPLAEVRRALEAQQAKDEGDPEILGHAFGELGELYLVYDLTEAAAAGLENARRLLPGQDRWPFLLGTLYEHDRQLVLAIERYREARRLRPDYLPTLLRLGRVYLLQSDLEASLEAYSAALRLDSGSAAAHAGLGKLAARRGEPRTATEYFEEALELQPTATALHYPLALAYRELGETDKAREQLAKRGDVEVRFGDPIAAEVRDRATGATVQTFLAKLALDVGSVDEALDRLQAAAAADPENAGVRAGLGWVLMREGRLEDGAEAYAEAVRLDGESPLYRVSLVSVLLELDREAEAVRHMRRVLELAPDFPGVRFQLAAALARAEDFEAAAREYALAIGAEPDVPLLRREYALVLERLERTEEMRTELETVLELAGDDALVLFKLANLELEAGETAAAERHYSRSLGLDPDLKEARMNLALLLGREKRYLEAAEHQARVVEGDPDDREAHLTLATARILGGALAEARKGLESALARHSDDPRIADGLARLLATAQDDEVRDGAMAVDIARRLFDAFPRVEFAETLAMALAEIGEFERAAELQARAVSEFARTSDQKTLEAANRRLVLYRRGTPERSPWTD